MSSVKCFPLTVIHHVAMASIDGVGNDTLRCVNKVLDLHMGKFTVIIMEIRVFKSFSFLDLAMVVMLTLVWDGDCCTPAS